MYLDTKGLVALWRETLLAKHVVEGKTKGYKYHPQLTRFKIEKNSIQLINQYLSFVYDEANLRGYHFDRNKISWNFDVSMLTVTNKQINYEVDHLLGKLKQRDRIKFNALNKLEKIKPHPLFKIVEGGIEDWEIIR
jgi:hypothetical protein